SGSTVKFTLIPVSLVKFAAVSFCSSTICGLFTIRTLMESPPEDPWEPPAPEQAASGAISVTVATAARRFRGERRLWVRMGYSRNVGMCGVLWGTGVPYAWGGRTADGVGSCGGAERVRPSDPDDLRAEQCVAVGLGGREQGAGDDRLQCADLGEPAEADRPELGVDAREHHAPRGPDRLRLDLADRRVGRGQAVFAGDAVGADERQVDDEAGEHLRRPVVHGGEGAGADPPAEQQDGHGAGLGERARDRQGGGD